MDLGALEHLVPAHVGEDRGQAFGKHALSGARRAHQEYVVIRYQG
jgi:hypothetical protein